MAKPATDPKITAFDARGKATRIKAERLEIDFGDGRKLLLAFPGSAWGDLEIEADADDEAAVPMLSLQPGACNLLTVRVDVHQDVHFEDPPERPPRTAPPVLTLAVQKAVEGQDKAGIPKKHQIRRWAQAALQRDAEVAVRLVGEAEGRELNREYRGKDYATNVLTFVYDDLPHVAGDIVICPAVVAREALEQGKAIDAHYAHLTVHGVLHLQGYDHEDDAEAEEMERRETQIVTKLGYPDPYRVMNNE